MILDHIGIAVKDLKESLKFFKDVLGLELIRVEEVPEEKVKVAMVKAGGVRLELLEATSEDSAIARFIKKRGEGIHHIALRVENAEEVSEVLRRKGLKLVYSEPKVVSEGSRKVNFIHPKSAHGILLEVMEVLKNE